MNQMGTLPQSIESERTMTVLEANPLTIQRHGQAAEAIDPQAVEEAEDGHLAHHFSTRPQQFSASKLGMWLFLGTEVLFFGGLFCYYAVYRSLHPEIFNYGAQFLNAWLGAANTMVLILSSMTMAAGVTFVQRGQSRRVAVALAFTLAGGATFMVIKYFEYSHKIHENLVWGPTFYERPAHHDEAGAGDIMADAIHSETAVAAFVADAARGHELWMNTCRSCHGLAGEGITGQGKDIRGSEFIASKTDEELLAFVKTGRMPFDKLNTTGLQMPPRGGNPLLKDDDLRHIIAYVRSFAPIGGGEAVAMSDGRLAANGESDGAANAMSGTDGSSLPAAPAPKPDLYVFKSVIPTASPGPSGIASNFIMFGATGTAADPATREEDAVPRDAHLFFNAYFMMTGLHGIHVLAGMGLISWLLVGALRGRYGPGYFTPVDLGGLYWHLVDLIWIFLFPLLYLI